MFVYMAMTNDATFCREINNSRGYWMEFFPTQIGSGFHTRWLINVLPFHHLIFEKAICRKQKMSFSVWPTFKPSTPLGNLLQICSGTLKESSLSLPTNNHLSKWLCSVPIMFIRQPISQTGFISADRCNFEWRKYIFSPNRDTVLYSIACSLSETLL